MSNSSPPNMAGPGENGPPQKEFLIVAITPQFLERGVLWFAEHMGKIKHAVKTESFWKNNAVILEEGLEIKPGEFLRHLSDFGYEKTGMLFGKGEFTQKGNLIDVWPINSDIPFKIEFLGNTIEHIFPDMEAISHTEPKRTGSKRTLRGLKSGDYVVHVDHGIGIFRGTTANAEIRNQKPQKLNKFQDLNSKSEIRDLEFCTTKNLSGFFVVEYAPPKDRTEPDRLFVPIEQEKRLSPYIGFETPAIHRLGGSLWTSTKKRAKEDAEKFAQELIKIYASREAIRRLPYELDETMNREFAEAFEFTETADQAQAIKDIEHDLQKKRPMDRIVCGDVGFGKTEVAMRAAFMAVESGYQVAVITPTTVLAYEHGKNFVKRFEKFPITVASLSRLTHKDEKKKTLSWIENGTCDIVIGTHRLLSKDIHFKNLGLVIVDEEQKFGVRQKERFKELRSSCDILSLSATPIPRTLNFALAGIREISTIQTAPEGRLPIKTFILPHSYKTFARSVAAELERDGQVYFLHNRIETIGIVKEKLGKAIAHEMKKNARLEVIHARLPEESMIRIMEQFRDKKIDVLVATTIIENGLDFSNANTLIVDDGTRLGLAQAYQIRGRIGRGETQSFSYFAYRPKSITETAMERLLALKEFEELGSGYDIALKDLEMRGAGNMLGREQSGAINRVGLNLYCQVLAEAVEELKLTQGNGK
ncbi:MAG: hypothetical protein A3A28_00110 [Candidatus Sungbacteria bacterium RIFCSPLOWO2_01_FULL_47_32]|uniref:TRCF n=1 Tax=Candidatus Sungbacteria bacterium RIFCSPHIGHO2_01_FULL_47_32 TaxID=1802264 RepID=A0A1G2K7C8_9BACT|nr:MAG: hypothetical protein A2633_06145 [Candidatus Sungbacteria bacterium RIFCSPHIGHO2_01_FULL_47_32]OHA06222.1 MAG: hypothetical protein A3A28_00110 [Candidatus Sungbacteria bacterium RIFCSPLOWO2_01_FULL_47_32]